MAKKKATTAPPTADKVARHLRAGDFAAALTAASELHALTPTPENLELRKKTITAAADHFAEQNKYADFNRTMDEAATLAIDDPAWTTERACLLARGGKLREASALVGPDALPRVVGHGVDRAVRLQARESLPEEHRAGYDSVLDAFRYHEAGDEAKTREALDPIGLRSPFLEWKVLLRGLLAFAAGDDARAAENWRRLDPTRLPHRLAAAVKAPNSQLTTSPLVSGLRAVARELGRDRSMVPAFRAADAVLPQLKKDAPHLVPRLANCLYHALIRQGQPEDLPRYRRLFGSPPDDPEFHNLQAQILEQLRNPDGAHAHWKKYEAWLAANPTGWPAPLAARARAVVWVRMGENAEEVTERRNEPADPFDFGPPRRKPKQLDPPAEACFRRAAELAPDWAVAAHGLFEALVAAKKPADAEAAARAYLTRDPTYLPALVALARLIQEQGRSAEAADLWLRAAAVNPLDKSTRLLAALSVLATARKALVAGDDAEAVLAKHDALLKEFTPGGTPALRAVIATKQGRPGEAAAFRALALAAPGLRVASAYRMAVDSQLAKVKPADKRAADKLFAEELAKPPTPGEVKQALTAHTSYAADGVTYRGQKTHGTKLLDLAPRSADADAPEVEFEALCEALLIRNEMKHALKLIDACRRRFPGNPVFLVQRVQVGLARNERLYQAETMLRNAKKLAEKATEPRHREVAERIDSLLKQLAGPFGFFGGFFGDGD